MDSALFLVLLYFHLDAQWCCFDKMISAAEQLKSAVCKSKASAFVCDTRPCYDASKRRFFWAICGLPLRMCFAVSCHDLLTSLSRQFTLSKNKGIALLAVMEAVHQLACGCFWVFLLITSFWLLRSDFVGDYVKLLAAAQTVLKLFGFASEHATNSLCGCVLD